MDHESRRSGGSRKRALEERGWEHILENLTCQVNLPYNLLIYKNPSVPTVIVYLRLCNRQSSEECIQIILESWNRERKAR